MNTTHKPKKIITLSTLVLACLVLVAASLISIFSSDSAYSAAVKGFQPGNIMSDSVFTNKNSMNASQIQSFLNSKVPYCDTQGSKSSEYGGGTRKQYAAKKGVKPPFTCLRDYSQGGKSAARIIYDAAQEFSINPQVLIVLLQKEQGLVTDEWPWPVQYRAATGYGCPDTAACDSEYYGFTNQVRWSARMFRAIMNDSPTWYTPYKLGSNRIYWHPDLSRCGSSTVNIQNRTTVALYSYTPYRPNTAALNAGYGTGNSCSSYGNRNFYQYYKDWFGSTQKDDSYIGYRVKGAGMSSTTMQVGTKKTVSVRYKNIGSQSWYDSISAAEDPSRRPTVLLALHPNGKSESGFNGEFATPTRATEIFSKVFQENGSQKTGANANIVDPGETVEFSFVIDSPSNLDTRVDYALIYSPVIPASNGYGRINIDSPSTYFITLTPKQPESPINTIPDTTHIGLRDEHYSAYRLRGAGMSSTVMKNGTQKQASILLKNTGQEPWYDLSSVSAEKRPMVLMALHPSQDKESGFNAKFETTTRATQRISEVYRPNGSLKPTTSTTKIVNPGEVARISFTVASSSPLPIGDNYAFSYTAVLPSAYGKRRINISEPDMFYITLTP